MFLSEAEVLEEPEVRSTETFSLHDVGFLFLMPPTVLDRTLHALHARRHDEGGAGEFGGAKVNWTSGVPWDSGSQTG